MPLTLLNDCGGYILRLLGKKTSFNIFLPPSFKGSTKDVGAKVLEFFIKSGGLKFRLKALGLAATELSKLHSLGLVYCDISENNLFIINKNLDALQLGELSEHSSDPLSTESELNADETVLTGNPSPFEFDGTVWYIDADNIDYETKNTPSIVFTPGFVAPEIPQMMDLKKHVTCKASTDCFSFAVLAFKNIFLGKHPFDGSSEQIDLGGERRRIPNGNGFLDVSATDYGIVPWIYDEVDKSNSDEVLMPPDVLLNEAVYTLFRKSFDTNYGHTLPFKRPTSIVWAHTLLKASDRCIVCHKCGFSYDYGLNNCPYCNTKSPLKILFRSYIITNKGRIKTPIWEYAKEITDKCSFTLPNRLLFPFCTEENDTRVAEISITPADHYLTVRLIDCYSCNISIATTNHRIFSRLMGKNLVEFSESEKEFMWLLVPIGKYFRCIACSCEE